MYCGSIVNSGNVSRKDSGVEPYTTCRFINSKLWADSETVIKNEKSENRRYIFFINFILFNPVRMQLMFVIIIFLIFLFNIIRGEKEGLKIYKIIRL